MSSCSFTNKERSSLSTKKDAKEIPIRQCVYTEKAKTAFSCSYEKSNKSWLLFSFSKILIIILS